MPAVPADQRQMPRLERQHPYRAASRDEQKEINRESEQILRGVDDMLYMLALRYLPRGACRYLIEDSVQLVRLHLWKSSLAYYDAWRRPRVKLSSFLYSCAANRFRDVVRELARQKTSDGDKVLGVMPAPDCAPDREIEEIAKDVLSDPDRFLTPRQSRVFRAIVNRPEGTTMKTLAEQLGYASQITFAGINTRMRQRLLRLTDDIAASAS